MVQRIAQFASSAFSARTNSGRDANTSMTMGRWADLVFTCLAAIAVAFFITFMIGAASAGAGF